ncbi:PREDICTED: TOM1-like protein 2 isoform X2 [Papilio polytes]|uniref:TOM1-like protein 2 isoform X2 n=1 Tax=Papilio polytes TaxID=76194 RepID=UPI0006762639|nr:PREDICTED: TOM1-like protein 2 isoform X2 [Papilio polytes]
MSFFGVGNPFATPVGQKIEQATDGSLPSENWALNMEICDIINSSADGPKDAIKAIRKRLTQSAGRNYTVVMYTLTVLETCVKNCGKSLHILVCNKEFISDLVKLIGPKNDPPTVVQEKVLSLIQCWADAFQNQPELQGVGQIYNELRSKGVEFPMTDLDAMAPIFTPQRSVPDGAEQPVGSPQRAAPHSPSAQLQENNMATVTLSESQMSKLRGDLSVVEGNLAVMGDMLNELTAQPPHNHHDSDVELLNELAETLRAMQQRLVELVARLAGESPLTADLLLANDRLNNLLLRHSRFLNNRNAAKAGATPSAILGAAMGVPGTDTPKTGDDDALIDLSDDVPDVSKLSVQAAPADKSPSSKDEFDMFAQSRNLTYENTKTGGSSYADNASEQSSAGLAAAAHNHPLAASEANGGQESVTSSDFDKFLAERAAAADSLPTIDPQHPQHTQNAPNNPHTPRHRQINKEQEDSMFAL